MLSSKVKLQNLHFLSFNNEHLHINSSFIIASLKENSPFLQKIEQVKQIQLLFSFK